MLFRSLLFDDLNILKILWFEIAWVIILFVLIELFLKRLKLIVYLVIDLVLSITLFSMVIYERYFITLPTYHDLGQLNQVGSVSDSALMLISGKDYVFFFFDIAILLLFFVLRKFINYPKNTTISRKIMTPILAIAVVIIAINFYVLRDDKILDQALFADHNGVLNSQVVKVFQDKIRTKSSAAIDFTTEDVIKLKGNEPVPFSEHNYHGIGKDRNLIVIQIESLQDFVIGRKVGGQEITPNLNKWVEESFYFTNVFQQIGAGNTSDAEFIMNTSIYPAGETPTSSVIDDKELPSLPYLLRDKGYHTATFHADTIKYWDRHIMYPALGFNEYYDIEYYGEEDLVGFGPSDGYFYNKTMDVFRDYKEDGKPFYAHVLSLTSHTPFEMPADKEYLNLPDEYEGTLVGNYFQSVRYADETLGQFFQELKDEGLWENSIIVLYGDHSGLHGRLVEDHDVKLLRDFLGSPYSLVDRFNIPFIVSIPGETETIGQRIETTGGQMDMMPTVLNLMGIEPEGLYFGQNLLQYEHNLLGMRYYLSAGAFFNDEVLYIPETTRNDIRIYDLKGQDRYKDIEDPQEHFEEYYLKMLQLYEWSDAYYQSLTREEYK